MKKSAIYPFYTLKNCAFYTKTVLFAVFLITSCVRTHKSTAYDVIVLGGGTGGTSAAIQSARMGARTAIVAPNEWLGGMLTAAGVPAIDGNHNLPAGIWGEFRDSLYAHYGGPEKVSTGWVSMTLFEPHIGARIFRNISSQIKNLDVYTNTRFNQIERVGDFWELNILQNGKSIHVRTQILIDGTEMGDVAALLGVSYDIGMDAASASGEAMAPERANNIIQDLTYSAILKDYGPNANVSIAKPDSYDPSQFYCSCQAKCADDRLEAHPCETMLTYGKLPNEKYMINWPLSGNDYYAPIIEMDEQARQEAWKAAKNKTLQFLYYIQNELGYTNLGLADDEFPTADQLPFLPYYREGRRIHGLVRVNVNHIIDPYTYDTPLYKAGVVVGDYPIDHHHKELPDAPEIDFPSVPSFNLPIGILIPQKVEGLIMADKAMSVSNIVNGSSRLQPVILQIGQAAGALAALAAKNNIPVKAVDVRTLQNSLLTSGAYLVPSFDVKPDHPQFEAIQRIGATGILKGYGEAYLWANRTWFYPDSTISIGELQTGLDRAAVDYQKHGLAPDALVTAKNLSQLLPAIKVDHISEGPINRALLAQILDKQLDPFARKIDHDGNFLPLQ